MKKSCLIWNNITFDIFLAGRFDFQPENLFASLTVGRKFDTKVVVCDPPVEILPVLPFFRLALTKNAPSARIS